MPKTHVTLEQNYHANITARHHEWHSDVPESEKGDDNAPTPEELLMGALGACMSMTGKMYARRKGWQVDKITVTLDIERINAGDYPAYTGISNFVHEIREHIVIEGPLDDDQKTRIREIMDKCPVRRVLTTPTFFVEGQPQPE